MLKARFCQFYSVAYHITKIFFLPYKFYLQSLYRFILEIGVKRAVSQTFPPVQVLIRTLCFLVTTARTSAWPPNDWLLTRTTLSCLQSHLYLRLFWVRHLHHPLRTQRNWRSLFSHSFSWTWSRVAERKHDDLYTPIVSTIRIKPPKCLPFFLNKPLPGFWTRQVAGRKHSGVGVVWAALCPLHLQIWRHAVPLFIQIDRLFHHSTEDYHLK